MERMVQCVKLGRELPGLPRPPAPGELGQRIYNEVSAEAWGMWQRHAVLLMNHYGLNMADPNTREMLKQEMETYFFGEGARVPEGWAEPGSAPPAKGGGAPRRK